MNVNEKEKMKSMGKAKFKYHVLKRWRFLCFITVTTSTVKRSVIVLHTLTNWCAVLQTLIFKIVMPPSWNVTYAFTFGYYVLAAR